MIPTINQAILAVSNSFTASIIVKATVVVSVALVAARLARRGRASIRHTILTAGFAVLFALPIIAIIAPPIHVALTTSQPSSGLSNASQFSGDISLAPQTSKNLLSAATKPETLKFSLFDLLFAAWGIGAAIFLAPVIIGLRQVRTLRSTGVPWSKINSLAVNLANEAGIRRRIEVLLHESVAGPMTCGVFHPSLVFPVEAEDWNEADLKRAIAHELEHVRRADWLTHCLARIVCAAYWFHPVVWIAWRQLALEAERACDDAVLARSEATAYAEQLVALARQLTAANKSPLLAMASRSDLTSRVSAVLDARQPRGRVGLFAVGLASVVAAAVVTTISPARLVAAQAGTRDRGADWEKAAGGKMKFEVASVKENKAPANADTVHFNMPITTWDFPVGAPTGGLFSATNLPVDMYLGFAYKLQGYALDAFQRQLPANWEGFNGKRYDIEARAAGNPTSDQYRLMMQSLFADRFKLAVHWETKQMPVMALVLNKPGKMGPQLRAHLNVPPCPDTAEIVLPQIVPAIAGGFPLDCGVIAHDRKNVAAGNTRYFARNVSMASLAVTLTYASRELGKPIVDKTGLTGNYDFVFEYTPENSLSQPRPDGIRLTDALKDDLGLKLEPATAAVDVFILDHIEPPTPN